MRFYPPKELRSRGGLHLAERELNAWGRSKYAHRGEVGVEEKPWTTRQQHRPPLVTARCPQQPTSTLAASFRANRTHDHLGRTSDKKVTPPSKGCNP